MIEAASRLLATYLANALWEVPMVLGIALVCARLMRRAPWAWRHALWVGALAASALLPLCVPDGPVVNAVQLASVQGPGTTTGAAGNAAAASATTWLLGRPLGRPVPVGAAILWGVAGLFALYLIYRLALLGMAFRRTENVRRAACAAGAPEDVTRLVRRCALAWPVRGVTVHCSSEAESPMTLGFLRPVLILPEHAMRSLSEADFTAAIHHELAHIRRRDYALNLLYQLLYLPLSFHPAAGVIQRKIDETRELACDELAAERSASRTAYALSLVNVAEAAYPATFRRLGHALGIFDTDTMERRVLNLLKAPERARSLRDRALALAGTGLMAAGCLALVPFSLNVAHPCGRRARMEWFEGTWEGRYQGKRFVVLRLTEQGGKLTGTCTRTEGVKQDRIVQARMTGPRLFLTIASADNDTPAAQATLELVRRRVAELRWISPASGNQGRKPWRIRRTSRRADRAAL